MAIDGDHIVVGASGQAKRKGGAYVYKRNGTLDRELKGEGIGDEFGAVLCALFILGYCPYYAHEPTEFASSCFDVT